MTLPTDITIITAPFALTTLILSLIQLRRNDRDIAQKKRELDKKIYETLVLREIGQRINYELKIDKILDVILDSLNTLLPFSVAGYTLVSQNATFAQSRLHLNESVNKEFLNNLRQHMLESFNKVTGRQLSIGDIQESVDGAIIDDSKKAAIASLWITSLAINERGLGILSLASQKPGLYQERDMQALAEILFQASRAVNNLEKILSAEEDRLNSMVASISDGILMLDRKNDLIMANPAAVRLLGLPQDAKPTTLDVVRALSDKIDLRAKIDESQRTNSTVEVKDLLVKNTASQVLISPVLDSQRGTLGTVVLFHDVTPQKQLDRIRDEFTAMMVHELRAPLTVVRGATDMFLKNPALSAQPQGQEILQTAQDSVNTMLSLVNDLLDVAKIEAGKFQILATKNNLADIIHDRVVFFTQLANTKSIALSADMPDTNLEAEFDKERISQVLNNLISNAVKFSQPGGKVVVSARMVNSDSDIHWRYGQPAGFNHPEVDFFPALMVSISDDGIGIPTDKLPQLFSKFKQFHPVGRDEPSGQSGTGLGLVITKGIIESHGGAICVESKENQGTTVHFFLPKTAKNTLDN